MACVFCDIIEKRVPAEYLYENEAVISILDIRPIHFGHALIIPKVHYKDFLEVPKDTLSSIIETTHLISCALVKSMDLKGFNFFANNGEVAGQSVFHFHIHITPRYAADNIRFVLELRQYEGSMIKDTASRIRAAIQS
jgi:histidine triad (HIT) family protein